MVEERRRKPDRLGNRSARHPKVIGLHVLQRLVRGVEMRRSIDIVVVRRFGVPVRMRHGIEVGETRGGHESLRQQARDEDQDCENLTHAWILPSEPVAIARGSRLRHDFASLRMRIHHRA